MRALFENGCSETKKLPISEGLAVEIVNRREVRTVDLLAKWPYSEAK